jgi:hypothetical protein
MAGISVSMVVLELGTIWPMRMKGRAGGMCVSSVRVSGRVRRRYWSGPSPDQGAARSVPLRRGAADCAAGGAAPVSAPGTTEKRPHGESALHSTPPRPDTFRRRDLVALLGLAAAAGSPRAPAAAQAAWPERPVRLIVPFGPGGAIDTLSRAVAQPFQQIANGQPLVVENRGGAGGTIAGGVVATARPDGYTLMMADLGANAVGKELIPSLSYDPLQAFTPIVHW